MSGESISNDGLKQLGQIALDAEENELLVNNGGEAGGKVYLKRSELEAFRRAACRYPIVDQDRHKVVTTMMDIVGDAKSKRLRISAAKVVVAMDRVNLDEVKTFVAVKENAEDKGQQSTVGTQINIAVQQNVTVQAVLDEYADLITPGAIPAQLAESNGSGKSVHLPETNGKAG